MSGVSMCRVVKVGGREGGSVAISRGYTCLSRHFLYPATSKSAGYYVIPTAKNLLLSVRPSVRPSALRFRALT